MLEKARLVFGELDWSVREYAVHDSDIGFAERSQVSRSNF